MTVVGAGYPRLAWVMRKLVHIAYGVLKSGKPFDPELAKANP
jgi:hypothetical protein